MAFKRFGLMICVASTNVMQIKRIKHLIDLMKKMGYNYLELVIDDVYTIDEEPYFGYLRGGYSHEELRELDDYAYANDIELVPCIQTLAHLTHLVKLPAYYDIVDIDDILMIDEPRTYELVDRMFKSIRSDFRTNIVNIGMDEAHKVGLGNYLDKHGYTNRFDLLLRHLSKVLEIAEKYGFKAHMWSDMFFRLASKGEYYKKGLEMPQEVIDKVPENVALCYWDYCEHEMEPEMFDEMFRQHAQFGREVWFAGGAWCWNGFAPHNNFSIQSMKMAIEKAKKYDIENVMITLWSNEGNECPFYATLPSLYAIKQYSEGNFDEASIRKGFKEMFGMEFDDFMLTDLPNVNSNNKEMLRVESTAKTLLYNDCFLGWKDSQLEKVDHIPYDEYAKKLRAVAPTMGEFKYIFDKLIALCDVLEVKAELGLRTRRAYKANDKAELKKLMDDYEEAVRRIEIFRKISRDIWMMENKPYGWTIHQIRLGGLMSTITDQRERIGEYLEGKVDSIPELEEVILPYADWGLQYNEYRGLVTVSNL